MLRKIGQEYCKVEADFLSRIVKSFSELDVVNFAIVIGVATRQHEFDLLPKKENKRTL